MLTWLMIIETIETANHLWLVSLMAIITGNIGQNKSTRSINS